MNKGSENLLHSLLAMSLNQELCTAECDTLNLSTRAVWECCASPTLKEESVHVCMCVCVCVCACVWCVCGMCICVSVCVWGCWGVMTHSKHIQYIHTPDHVRMPLQGSQLKGRGTSCVPLVDVQKLRILPKTHHWRRGGGGASGLEEGGGGLQRVTELQQVPASM